MKVVMDGKEVTAKTGQTILETARQNGVYIPTLCHDPSLEPAAMCRLCTVELTENRRTRLVTSCNFPLRGDVEIRTDTEKLRQGRKLTIELLYTRCPDSERLKELAKRYGADLSRFAENNKDCIMCGLCARVCEKVGGNVLTLCGRGVEIRVGTSFDHIAEHCTGCGACVQICPVNKIRIQDEGGFRRIILKGKESSQVPLRKCMSCGVYFGPVIDLAEVMERAGETQVPPPNAHVCPACSRRNLARRLAERHFEQYAFEPLDAGEEG
jgi:bidirectional [NiFe] hydrogenase diaphorase subunit